MRESTNGPKQKQERESRIEARVYGVGAILGAWVGYAPQLVSRSPEAEPSLLGLVFESVRERFDRLSEHIPGKNSAKPFRIYVEHKRL